MFIVGQKVKANTYTPYGITRCGWTGYVYAINTTSETINEFYHYLTPGEMFVGSDAPQFNEFGQIGISNIYDLYKVKACYFSSVETPEKLSRLVHTDLDKPVLSSKEDWLLQTFDSDLREMYKLSKKRKLRNSTIRGTVQKQVQLSRKTLLGNWMSADKLQKKIREYGNSGGWSEAKIAEFEEIILQDKAPRKNYQVGKLISVEIECIFPDYTKVRSFISFVRKKGYKNDVTVKEDGSLRSGDCDNCGEPVGVDICENCEHEPMQQPKEIVITTPYGEWGIIEDICSELDRLKCYVNTTCGLHVHFDCRNIESTDAIDIIGSRLARCISALKLMLPKSRSDNQYCRAPINKIGSRDRYAFVNLGAYDKHKTIEIRGHSGTTKAIKIINWIKILRTIMDKPVSPMARKVKSASTLLRQFKFDNDVKQYIIDRIAKFSRPDDSYEDDVSLDNQTAA